MMDLLNCIGVPWALHLGDRVPVDITTNTPSIVPRTLRCTGEHIYARARILSVSQHLLDEMRFRSEALRFRKELISSRVGLMSLMRRRMSHICGMGKRVS